MKDNYTAPRSAQELEKLNNELAAANEALRLELDEARSANAAKDVFLSSMSHDIRTPMNAIVGMTALAQKHIDEKSRVMDALSKIEVASAHLLSLINEVLDMSRINSGTSVITVDNFYLGDLLHETLTMVLPQIEARHHHFSFNTDSIMYESLYGDTLRLRQIFVNIISNAVKYTSDGGKIDVSITEEVAGDICTLVFSCRDNGIGMTEEFLSRIFTPFERANTTTASGIEGTGLGMSIVKKLIDAMGGTIDIRSRPNEGTGVVIRIPMHFDVLKTDTESLKGKSLLILEGNTKLRSKYEQYLDSPDIRFIMVSDAADAVSEISDAAFNGRSFDAFIIGNDIGISGTIYDIAGYIHKASPSIPIVLISSVNWEEIEYRAQRSGIEAFIPVPFFAKSLLNGLANLFDAAGDHDPGFTQLDLTGKNILLVEDNLINQEVAKEILSSTGAEIFLAENGEEAVKMFSSSEEWFYDLILMDIQMPVMDGYTAAKTLRAMDREDAARAVILAMTANAFAEDIAKARQAGMNGHIAKPIDINKLMTTLRHYLNQPS